MTYELNPNTNLVDIKVRYEHSNQRRYMGLLFQNIDFTSKYITPPNFEISKYAVIYSGVDNCILIQNSSEYYINDTNTCGNIKPCAKELPIQQITNNVFEFKNGINYYNFTIPTINCGYEFNKFEFEYCRPQTFTIISPSTKDETCLSDDVNYSFATQQYNAFITPNPTSSPTLEPTIGPTTQPTTTPSFTPTSLTPTDNPSVTPTLAPVPTPEPSTSPSDNPTRTPTVRPSSIPSVGGPIYDEPECPTLYIESLSQAFPMSESNPLFEQQPGLFNNRRIWRNDMGVRVFYSRKYDIGGDWVITNGSYTLISVELSGNNSRSLPGEGFERYDHFPNDDVLKLPSGLYTIKFSCSNSTSPTMSPSSSPISVSTPPTSTPTVNPTVTCNTLTLTVTPVANCPNLDGYNGIYVKQNYFVDGYPTWKGINETQGISIYFADAELLGHWIVDAIDVLEYAAIIEADDTLFPPNNVIYNVYKDLNLFAPRCSKIFSYVCDAFIPETPEPSPSPTAPTTLSPTTPRPTDEPSISPSYAPTNNPTSVPTYNPIQNCLELDVNGAKELNGRYVFSNETLKTSSAYYFSLANDYEIFYSLWADHESWVIYSSGLDKYWLAQSNPPQQPPLNGKWDLYSQSHSQPDIIGRTIILTCYTSRSPTTTPTISPTVTPTSSPSRSPTTTPTNDPSSGPSSTPTTSPTLTPTVEPTQETLIPSISPVMQTESPTRVACQYLSVSSDSNNGLVQSLMGEYTQYINTTYGEWDRYVGTKVFIISYDNSNQGWKISSEDNIANNDLTLKYISNSWKPPRNSSQWSFNYNNDTYFSIDISCSNTQKPTTAPSINPTYSPTNKPTSPCFGLQFINEDDNSFKYNNNFYIRQEFLRFGRNWYVSRSNDSIIEFYQGLWTLFTNDLKPILLTNDGQNAIVSPPLNAMWLDINDGNRHHTQINVTIKCFESYAPTYSPSQKPSISPTIEPEPQWLICQDKFFSVLFASNNGSVYWTEPIPNLDIIQVTRNPNKLPGTPMPTGLHNITYLGIDPRKGPNDDPVLRCDISIYVVRSDEFTALQLCQKDGFYVEAIIDGTNTIQERILTDADKNDGTIIEAQIVDPTLSDDNKLCLITSKLVSSYEPASAARQVEVFGQKISTTVIEILIAVILCIIIILIIDCCFKCYRDSKAAADEDDNEQLKSLLSLDSANANNENNNINNNNNNNNSDGTQIEMTGNQTQ